MTTDNQALNILFYIINFIVQKPPQIIIFAKNGVFIEGGMENSLGFKKWDCEILKKRAKTGVKIENLLNWIKMGVWRWIERPKTL